MATNAPTGLDTFTDPTGTDPMTDPEHAGQHADLNDALTQWQKLLVGPVNYNAKAYGALGNGIADDTTALNDFIADLNTYGGLGIIPAGSYKHSASLTTITNPAVTLIGVPGATVLEPTSAVTGSCLVYRPTSYSTYPPPGGVYGLRINGANAGSGAVGFEYGDMDYFSYDIVVENFPSTSSQIGIWEVNKIAQTERTRAKACLIYAGFVWDVDGGSTTSHDYGHYDLWCSSGSSNTMFTWQNGSTAAHDEIDLKGNAGTSATIISIKDTSSLTRVHGSWLVECDGSGVTDLSIASGAKLSGSGMIDFLAGTYSPSSSISGTVEWMGWWAAGAAAPNILSGYLASDVSLPASTAETVETITLPVGYWLLDFNATLLAGSSGAAGVELYLAAGTATASFLGPKSVQVNVPTSATSCGSLSCLVKVTVAGTVTVGGYANSYAATVKASTPANSHAQASGYTATLVAPV